MKKYLFLLMLLFFFLYGTANAAFYTWEDENGVTQITDYPPPQGKSAKDVQVRKYESDKLTDSQNNEEQKSALKDNKSKSQKPPDVVIYTKNDCKDCDKAREFLKSQNISFTEYNMDNDKTAAARRKQVDDTEDVPFAIINKNQVYGFSESVYNKALKPNP
jgi:glutaredoxin 3